MKKALNQLRCLLTPGEKKSIGVMFALALGASAMEILAAGVLMVFAQILLFPAKYSYEILGLHFQGGFLFWAGSLAGVFFLKNAVALWETWYQSWCIQKTCAQFQQRLLARYAGRSYIDIFCEKTAFSTEILTYSVEKAFSQGVTALAIMGSEALILVCLVSVLFMVEPQIAFLNVISAGIISLALIKIMPYFHLLGDRLQDSSLQYAHKISEFFQAFKDIILWRQKDAYLKECQMMGERKFSAQAHRLILSNGIRIGAEFVFISQFVLMVCLLYFWKVPLDQMVGLLGGYVYAGFRLIPSSSRFLNQLTLFKAAVPFVEQIFCEYQRALNTHPLLDLKDFQFCRKIEVNNLSFSYPTSLEAVLKDVSLSLEKGTSLGVMGKTGAGKSTFLDVFLGLLPIDSEMVRIDDQFPAYCVQWHQKIGYVPQSLFLLDQTIKANVCMHKAFNPVLFWDVMQRCDLVAVVEKLPMKENTWIGEKGICLSGGERQRLSIARALYKEPEVLILDEMTSALDHQTEDYIIKNILKEVQKGCTVVMVAHRLGTLLHCDQVLMLEKGRMVGLFRRHQPKEWQRFLTYKDKFL